MTAHKTLPFAKAHALGNDFLFIEDREMPSGVGWADVARAMCHRLRGIGADGLIVFRVGEEPRYTMKLINADGSPAEISGNGLRCLGAYLLYSGRATQDPLRIETDAGARVLETVRRERRRFVIRSGLGVPRLSSRDVPFEIDPPTERVVDVPLQVGDRTFRVTALNMGNPQCVVLTDRLDMDELRAYGPLIERHPRFPQRTNVEFVEVVDRTVLEIGIWERGAGETAASGTGSAAAAVAARLRGRVDERVTVRCPGGMLEVEWRDGREVYVTGEAVVVAEGSYLWE